MAGREFQVVPAVQCGTLLGERDNGGPYRRGVPTICGPVAAWMPQAVWSQQRALVHPPAAQVVLLRDATVRGPGVVTLPGDRVVAETLINTHEVPSVAGLRRVAPDRYLAEPGLPAGVAVPPGRRFVLLKQMWDSNYGHWLIELLPRLGLLDGVVDLAACGFIIAATDEPMRGVITQSLAAFGITERQIARTGAVPQHFAELILPLPLTVQPWIKAPFAVRVLEALGARIGGSGSERVFIRRLPGSRRMLHNAGAIEAAAVARGFTVVTPGELAFADQVAAFRAARLVVGVLGAECANLAFAPAGVRLLGLAPPDMLDDFFYDLIAHKAGRYACLHGETDEPEAGMNARFTVDPAVFETMLEE